MKIKGRTIGQNSPTYVIAEMSANHAGSIENAKKIIRAAKESGADCVKLQTYTADTLTIDCHNKYFDITDGTWKGENLYSLYQKAYTPWEWHKELFQEAKRIGIDIFSTPFDKTAVDFLESIHIEFYKIASFELVDIPLIRYVASKGKPIIMSTGMATLGEIEEAVQAIREEGNEQIALLKCASAYPAVSDTMNLQTIKNMEETFGVPAGLSDHSMGHLGAVIAVAMGAKIIEKHFCLSREIENPDASFSMEPNEFKEMVEFIRSTEKAIGRISYGPTEQELGSIKFRRSLFAVEDIKAGEVFTEKNIRSIRPGYGLPPKYIDDILGKRAIIDYKRGVPLDFSVFGENKLLFLTNNENTSGIYNWLLKKEEAGSVIKLSDKINIDMVKQLKPSYIISFNYRYIISKEIIEYMNGKAINMHISYLPYNRGSAPNFFSFYDNTPKGVTIHQIDQGLDTGPIYCRKQIGFCEEVETFSSSYEKLMIEMEKLFIANWEKIKLGKIKPVKQEGNFTVHSLEEYKQVKKKYPFCWNDNILTFKKKYLSDNISEN